MEVNPLKYLHYFLNILKVVLWCIAKDYYIIDINQATHANELAKEALQYPLEVRWGVPKPKGEHVKGIQSIVGDKGGEGLRVWMHRDLPIPRQ